MYKFYLVYPFNLKCLRRKYKIIDYESLRPILIKIKINFREDEYNGNQEFWELIFLQNHKVGFVLENSKKLKKINSEDINKKISFFFKYWKKLF